MKNILILLSFILFTLNANAQSPWYFGTGEAVNLTDAIKYKSGIRQIAGPLDPTVTAVPGEAGSLYLSTSGNFYIKQDSGLSTNWNLVGAGGGGGGISTINGQSGPSVSIAVGTSGTNANVTATGNTVTVNLPTSSATNRGLLSSADWTDFNSKEDGITAGTSTQIWQGDKTWVEKDSLPISTDTQTALNGKEDTVVAGTTSDYYRGDKTWQVLDKTSVGLENVDNTSDLDKPISTATQSALDLKLTTPTDLPIIRPTLNLDFANSKTLDPRVTFERPSIRTCINAFGLIVSLAINEPCFDHDPDTLESKGLLIEESRTNLFEYSNQFGESYWSKTRSSVVANAGTGPDGSLTAWRLSDTTENNSHFLGRSFIPLGNTAYTLTVFVKKYEGSLINHAGIQFGNFSNQVAANPITINLLDGTYTATDLTRSKVKKINGGYLVSTTITTIASPSSILPQVLLHNGSATVYAGDGNGSILVSDFQLEAGSFPTSLTPSTDTFTSRASTATYIGSDGLIKTAAVNEARYSYNPENLNVAPKLLLEGSATNLATYSGDFTNAVWIKSSAGTGTGVAPVVTANAGVGPDGTSSADRIVFDIGAGVTGADRSDLYLNENTVIGTTYTASFWVKSNTSNSYIMLIDFGGAGGKLITVTPTWKRFSSTYTATLTTNRPYLRLRGTFGTSSYADVLVDYAQFEEGYLSSNMKTTGTTVTRSADVSTSTATTRSADLASMTGTNFSSWYRQDEGTFVVGAYPAANYPVATNIFSVSNNSVNERIQMNFDANNLSIRMFASAGGVSQASSTFGTATLGVKLNASLTYKKDNWGASLNGGTVTKDTSGLTPAVNRIYFSANPIGTAGSMHLSRFTYYPKLFSDATTQAVAR